MSKYTTQVRFICEQYAGKTESSGYDEVDEIIEAAAPLIFADSIPFFDENYRLPLEKKILKHYYTREIGAETVGLWKLWLNATMSEIMPLYNQFYESARLQFNPLYDQDYIIQHTGSGDDTRSIDRAGSSADDTTRENTEQNTGSTFDQNTNNRTENSSGNTFSNSKEQHATSNYENGFSSGAQDSAGTSKNRKSDTPENTLSGVDDNKYLSEYQRVDDSGNSSTFSQDSKNSQGTDETTGTAQQLQTDTKQESGTQTGQQIRTDSKDGTGKETREGTTGEQVAESGEHSEEWIESHRGKVSGGSYAAMLKEYRETFLNIDIMVINDLKDLFMLLY